MNFEVSQYSGAYGAGSLSTSSLSGDLTAEFYFGPVSQSFAAVLSSLETIVDFGLFDGVAVPIVQTMVRTSEMSAESLTGPGQQVSLQLMGSAIDMAAASIYIGLKGDKGDPGDIGGLSGGSGIVIIGNEVRLSIGTLPYME